jgi:hypothetical protein
MATHAIKQNDIVYVGKEERSGVLFAVPLPVRHGLKGVNKDFPPVLRPSRCKLGAYYGTGTAI